MKQSKRKEHNGQIALALAMIALSTLFYVIHYTIFHDLHHIFLYLIGDIAFVFIEVLLVTIIIHDLLESREKRLRLNKMNMIIGIFFTETGTELLYRLSCVDRQRANVSEQLSRLPDWKEANRKRMKYILLQHAYDMDASQLDWLELREFLRNKRDFLLRLLENPNLLEHEAFSDVLLAVFHLIDELTFRQDLAVMDPADRTHLEGDITRVYERLSIQWLNYMIHLRSDYPYLFALALKRHPLGVEAPH